MNSLPIHKILAFFRQLTARPQSRLLKESVADQVRAGQAFIREQLGLYFTGRCEKHLARDLRITLSEQDELRSMLRKTEIRIVSRNIRYPEKEQAFLH